MSAIVERQPVATSRRNRYIALGVVLVLLALFVYSVQDWHQIWKIVSAPDNIPIVAMLFLVPFFTWLGIKQAKANDNLIVDLEGNKDLAKTHHRKVEPWRPGWAKELHVWPYLVRIEFLAAVIVTVVLYAWSILLNAPLEEPANPNLTMNPSKAPWYFLGLQEMLHYFPPVVAGVLVPGLVVMALIVIPYFKVNIEADGLFLKDRQKRLRIFYVVAAGLSVFLLLFKVYAALVPTLIMAGVMLLAAESSLQSKSAFRRYLAGRPLSYWVMTWFLFELVVLTAIGTFFRGPGWEWVWPWQGS
jgi:hypothetical protein